MLAIVGANPRPPMSEPNESLTGSTSVITPMLLYSSVQLPRLPPSWRAAIDDERRAMTIPAQATSTEISTNAVSGWVAERSG